MIEFVVNTEHPVEIPAEDVVLNGLLHIPNQVHGLIIFAHGSGSSRFSPRNQFIARELQQKNFATLLFDLMTNAEDEIDSKTAELRFDIPFLAKRLEAATNWILNNPVFNRQPIGYFGASTGGAAALVAAAHLPNVIKAVVSRGGRPDLADPVLQQVKAATLLLVGGNDNVVIQLNEQALGRLNCEKKLLVIPGASYLFEEPGKLDEVAKAANEWFLTHLKMV